MGEVPQQLSMGGSIQTLAPLPDLFVKQTRRGCIQEMLGCEAKSEFKIATKGNQQADVMYALEESNFFVRLLWPRLRPWVVNVSSGPGTPGGPLVSQYERPCRCNPSPCKCFCFQEVYHKDANGTPLGSTMERYYIFVPKFAVTRADASVEYLISPPTCVGGMCVNICAEGLFSCRFPIYVYPPDATKFDTDNKIGAITKVFGGLGTELFTDADKFEVDFPNDAQPDSKARILGTVFLINQLFFEK